MASDTELAWAAGLFDGEGCVRMHMKRTRTKLFRENTSYYLSLSLANTDLVMLHRFLQIIGHGKIYQQRKGAGRWRPCWAWMATCGQAEAALTAMLPYLVGKSEQARLGLLARSYRGHPSQSRYGGNVHGAKLKEISETLSALKGRARKET